MRSEYVDAFVRTARMWQDPDHDVRAEAVATTVQADNRFTEEALAFAVNQKMAQITPGTLQAWIGDGDAAQSCVVGVIEPGAVPFDALPDVLATVLCGHTCLHAPAEATPGLLPAFVREVQHHAPEVPVRFADAGTVLSEADALITTSTVEDEDDPAHGISGERAVRDVGTECDLRGIGPSHRLLRGPCFSVAVLDGQENDDEREGLAEDALLYEGQGPRSVRLLWAPRGLDPDPYFEAMAHFRAVFPAHADTPGALQMQQAFLEAGDHPHAYGEGLEFLVSRGAPEVQRSGHLRWVEYDALPEVLTWMTGRRADLECVVARPGMLDRIPDDVAAVPCGQVHRLPLDHPLCGTDVVSFLRSL